MFKDLDIKKLIVAFLAMTGTVFTLGAVFSDYRDLPIKVERNTDAIHDNREAIRGTSQKLDAVLCLLVQDQFLGPDEELNPLLCLNGGVTPSSFLPGLPEQPAISGGND